MQKKKSLSLVLLILVTTYGLVGQNRITREQYIQQYQGLAQRQMESYGIPASIIIAQGILESGSGNSTLAVKANKIGRAHV